MSILTAQLRRQVVLRHFVDLLQGKPLLEIGPESIARPLPTGKFGAALLTDVDPKEITRAIGVATSALPKGAPVIVVCESRDRPGAKQGLSYYELHDALKAAFPTVGIWGMAPFSGLSFSPYGVAEAEPVIDCTLVERGEKVGWYVAVGSGDKLASTFGVVQVPATEAPVVAQTTTSAPAANKPAPAPVKAAPVDKSQTEKALEEARAAALEHARQMEALKNELSERDAFVTELEREVRQARSSHETLQHTLEQLNAVQASDRQARRELSEIKGRLLREQFSKPVAPPKIEMPNLGTLPPRPTAAPTTPSGEGTPIEARLAELEAENQKLREREADARAESWKHLKARSEAEAAAAEARDNTVRKLKDARKLASVELTHALEEATKKAVTLREELNRTLDERRELRSQIQVLTARVAELEAAAQAVQAAPPPIPVVSPTGSATPLRDSETVKQQIGSVEADLRNTQARVHSLVQTVKRLLGRTEDTF